MPFGLQNAGQSFQRYMDHVLSGLDSVYAYINDMLVASSSEEEHKKHLGLLFRRLKLEHCAITSTDTHLQPTDGRKVVDENADDDWAQGIFLRIQWSVLAPARWKWF